MGKIMEKEQKWAMNAEIGKEKQMRGRKEKVILVSHTTFWQGSDRPSESDTDGSKRQDTNYERKRAILRPEVDVVYPP